MMKRLCIMVALIAVVFVFSACQKEGDIRVSEEYGNDTVTDDAKPLSTVLTKEYSLQELKNYFGEIPPNERQAYGIENDDAKLSMRSVNQKFPIECLRGNEYSVYKVSEGGYFYVFWVKSLNLSDDGSGSETNDYYVSFTAFISSLKNESDFGSIKEGMSTASDVASIDPALEFVFLLSSKTPSYSLLDDGSIMEICYDWDGNFRARSDLIVKSKKVISKEQSASRLASIIPNDLP